MFKLSSAERIQFSGVLENLIVGAEILSTNHQSCQRWTPAENKIELSQSWSWKEKSIILKVQYESNVATQTQKAKFESG